MMFKMMKTSKLNEHPENRKLFPNISETNPIFWEEFKDSIIQFGIIEPLIVDQSSKNVRSGNQRLLAAIELELEEVPVVLVDPEDPEVEIDKMVASNVYRRTIDAFAMFPYIGKLRRGASSIAKKGQTGLGSDDIAAQVHKPQKFVSAADVFNAMGKEEKEAIEGWHREKADRSETALIAELRKIEKEALKSDEKYDELVDSTRSYQEREATLQEMLEDRDGQIAELTDVDHEGEIEDRDAKIRLLQNQKRKLSQKLKETQETPDLHAILSDAIGKQLSVNSVLKEIVEYKDSLNQNMLTELLDAVYRTVEILKGVQTTEQNAQKEITQ